MRQFYPAKNDFFFALLIAAVFAVTVAGAITGSLDLARGRVGADYAKTRAATIALRGNEEQAPQVKHAGARK
jgi:hypothetical protein